MNTEKEINGFINELQSFITEGKQVVIKKQNIKTECYISVNLNTTENFKKWSLILNGNEFFCKEIIFNLPTRTSDIKYKDFINKNPIVKSTVFCEANEIKFENNIATII